MSREEKKQPHAALRYYGGIVGFLLALCACAALVLGVANLLTGEKIQAAEEQRRQAEMSEIVPGDGVTFSQLAFDREKVDDMYIAYQSDLLRGYCVYLTEEGFQGSISMVVSIDAMGRVAGIKLLEHQETRGVGDGIEDINFLACFRGRSGEIRIGSEVAAVAGATVSSRAVARGVTRALEAVSEYRRGGMELEEGEV